MVKAPFTYFGGKSSVASIVWQRFGHMRRYIEPFCGSAAVLLLRPDELRNPANDVEIINDIDGMVVNFWRATKYAPEEVAKYADWPVFENDLHARNAWMVNTGVRIVSRLEGDPDFFDAKVAGWWVWGRAMTLASAWMGASGPWKPVDGELVQDKESELVGVSRGIMNLGSTPSGKIDVHRRDGTLYSMFKALHKRLDLVKVVCGSWKRTLTPAVNGTTNHLGPCAVFLDPPYTTAAGRQFGVYTHDDDSVGYSAAKWAIENGDNPHFRIALCGYEGEYEIPSNWECVSWKAAGGFGRMTKRDNRSTNRFKERIWFSPHCLKPTT
jgi:hypothetical protein